MAHRAMRPAHPPRFTAIHVNVCQASSHQSVTVTTPCQCPPATRVQATCIHIILQLDHLATLHSFICTHLRNKHQ